MTSAQQERPGSALDLLFGPGNDTPEALAHQIVSAGTDGNVWPRPREPPKGDP